MTDNHVSKRNSGDYLAYTEIEIDAPADVVWDVLTDFASMPEWSSSFHGIEGEMKKGALVSSRYKMQIMGRDHIMDVKHELVDYSEGHMFGWSGGLGLGMHDHHRFIVEDLGNCKTLFKQIDEPHGGVGHVVGRFAANQMIPAYEAFNEELKARAEAVFEKA